MIYILFFVIYIVKSDRNKRGMGPTDQKKSMSVTPGSVTS